MVRFVVTGTSKARLEEAAAHVLKGFTDGEDYTFVIEARPAMESEQGEVLMWNGDVEAWPTKNRTPPQIPRKGKR
jgi:hypothetical protein